ncbi:DUF6503 family protein [Pontibacter burrus]|uniref:Outer membrane lipoprotein-sorting protein n=1 Tax=Pontibacter burrus TaxID=2704466 RepID=A0A6B3LGA9_9BACT|nr:DUF6503 family protein [Pontibacter burrus]NEM96102.1 hypothetical protein [Pontibacter burrus]
MYKLRNNFQDGVFWLLLFFSMAFNTAPAAAQDKKAQELAQKVMQQMGGKQGWNNTRFIAWSFRDQYQVWDKKADRFRWEKDSLVAIINTRTKDGRVYVDGKELQSGKEKQKLLDKAYAAWINNAYWLVMPFKLQDPGVNLKYIGGGKTMNGAAADMLEMTFDHVGLTPENKYHLWIDKKSGLITQWAYFKDFHDKEPTFMRRWADYKNYGTIMLASDRSNPESDFTIANIATPSQIPNTTFNSPRPIRKL